MHVNTTGYRQVEGEVLSTKAVIYELMGDYRNANDTKTSRIP